MLTYYHKNNLVNKTILFEMKNLYLSDSFYWCISRCFWFSPASFFFSYSSYFL